MNDKPTEQEPNAKDPIEGCTRLAVTIHGAVIAPIAAGLALGVATIVGGEVLLVGRLSVVWERR